VQSKVILAWSVPACRTMTERVFHRLIEQVSGQSDTHVTVIHRGYALSMDYDGLHIWPVRRYMESAPGLTELAQIDTPMKVDVSSYRVLVDVPVNPLPILDQWTRGDPTTYTCVWLARDLLSRAGVNLPNTVQTPAHLREFVHGKGYQAHLFE